MEKNGWARTILSVYVYLERVTGAIDKVVKARAENSFHFTSSSFAYNDIISISDHILNLTERKVNLINLKIICESVLEKIDLFQAKLLISAFIDKRKSHETAQLLHISPRSYFRKLTQALNAFTAQLDLMGYTDEVLKMLYGKEQWIMEAKSKHEKQNDFLLQELSIAKVYNQYKYNGYSFNHQIQSNQTF